MRVQLVNDHPHGGGAEVHLHALAALLSGNGDPVDILTGTRRPIHYASRIFNPWLALVAWNRFRVFRPDVVHVHKYNLVWSIAPFIAAKSLRIPVVCTQHDFGAVCPEGWMVRRDGSVCELGFGGQCFSTRCFRSTTTALDLYRRYNSLRLAIQVPVLRRTVSVFTAPSKFLADWVGRLYDGVESVALPLFVDPPEEHSASGPTGPIVLFHAGRIEREKGLDILLRAMAKVQDIRLRVAGNGAARPALMDLCRSLGIEDRVDWLGPVDRARVLRECDQAHLAVLPSLWVENAPLFVLEAMREGCPVAASDVGGYPDLIDPGVNGFLVERGSVEAWAELLVRVATGFDRSAMGRAARARIVRDHSPEIFLRGIHAIYARSTAAALDDAARPGGR